MSSTPDALSKMSRNCIIIPDSKSLLDALDKLDQAGGSDAWYLVVTSDKGQFRVASFEQIQKYVSSSDPSLPTMPLNKVHEPLTVAESIDKDSPSADAQQRARQNAAGVVVITWKGSPVGVLTAQEAAVVAALQDADAIMIAETPKPAAAPEINVSIGDDVAAPLNIAGDDVIITNVTQVESELTGGPKWLLDAANWARSNVIVLAIAFLVLAVIPVSISYLNLLPKPIKPMTGELNIAVVGFTPSGGGSIRRSDANAIANVFYSRLNSDLSEINESTDIAVQLRGPEEIASLSGKTEEELRESAAKLADQINAHIVIYGWVRKTDSGLSVEPRFYVELPNNYEAAEMTGAQGLGGAIEILGTNNLGAQIGVNNALRSRSEVMALVTKGLALYYGHQYDDAFDVFQEANNSRLWPTNRQREVLYIFQGNAAVRALRKDEAQAAYEAAIALEPEYSRGYAGLGSVYYLRALDNSTALQFRVDQKLLEEAILYYKQASEAEIQPETADLPIKISIGLGQIYTVQWVLNKGTHDLAVQEFESIIEAYDDGANPRIQEFAAEAYARLGLIARQEGDGAGAIAQFEKAIELSTVPNRRGLYWSSLAELYGDQGEAEKAENASEQAIQQYQAAMELTQQAEVRAGYWSEIAQHYLRIGQLDNAREAWADAAELAQEAINDGGENPSFRGLDAAANAHLRLAKVEAELDHLDTAIADYQAAIEFSIKPVEKAIAWEALGEIYEQQGEQALALEAYQKAIEEYTTAKDRTSDSSLQDDYQRKIDELQAIIDAMQ